MPVVSCVCVCVCSHARACMCVVVSARLCKWLSVQLTVQAGSIIRLTRTSTHARAHARTQARTHTRTEAYTHIHTCKPTCPNSYSAMSNTGHSNWSCSSRLIRTEVVETDLVRAPDARSWSAASGVSVSVTSSNSMRAFDNTAAHTLGVCVCVHARVRASVRVCVCAYVCACAFVCVNSGLGFQFCLTQYEPRLVSSSSV